jgi:hypothetical protein
MGTPILDGELSIGESHQAVNRRDAGIDQTESTVRAAADHDRLAFSQKRLRDLAFRIEGD